VIPGGKLEPNTEAFEQLFLESISEFPENLPDLLENDFDYSLENQIVMELAGKLDDAHLSKETLSSVQFRGFLKSARSIEFSNGEDYVLQAVLASKATPSDVLDLLVAENPDWLTGGWWCLMRLVQNPNTSSDLLLQASRLADLDSDSELVEEILNHRNCTEEIVALFD
jgi:hypothetical protein